MIAALVLLDASAAKWAERDIVFVLVCPSCKLAFHCLFARYVLAMPLVAALEANFCAAFWTRHLSCIFVLSSHNFAALGIDTVSDERIRVKFLLVFESAHLVSKVAPSTSSEDLSDLLF